MRKRAFGLAVAMIVGIALVSASGALATTNTQTATRHAQTATKIDVSTRAAVVHYLRSIHVSAKGVVIQRGLRNYAGAHCPGKGWTCAGTRHTVVQIAKRGGLNRFACRTAKCVVVQFGGASRGLNAASRASSSLATTDRTRRRASRRRASRSPARSTSRTRPGRTRPWSGWTLGSSPGCRSRRSTRRRSRRVRLRRQAPRTTTSPAFIRLSRSMARRQRMRGASRSRVTLISRSRSSRTR